MAFLQLQENLESEHPRAEFASCTVLYTIWADLSLYLFNGKGRIWNIKDGIQIRYTVYKQ
jgi:hypothetical protein